MSETGWEFTPPPRPDWMDEASYQFWLVIPWLRDHTPENVGTQEYLLTGITA